MAETVKKQLKTFSLHEKNMKYVAMMKKAVLRYKHVENMLNIILNKEADIEWDVAPLPKGERAATSMGGENVVVMNGAKQSEAAVKLAAMADAAAFIMGPQGLLQHLQQPQIGFEWNEEKQVALSERVARRLEEPEDER